MDKVKNRAQAAALLEKARRQGQTIVFTNGCFDILHIGHTRYLAAARALGDMLVVGVNSDASVRALEKAPDRPLVAQDERAEILASLRAVDMVCIFEEPTPLELISALQPDVLVKGGDWAVQAIVGAEQVLAVGGRVLSIPFVDGHSTTSLVERIRGGGCNVVNKSKA